MLGHKLSPNKFKMADIISGNFSGYNSMQVEINNGRKTF